MSESDPPIKFRFAVLSGISEISSIVAELVGQNQRIIQQQEKIMAQFEGLDADLAAMQQSVADTAARVEAAVAVLLDDTADQAQVDAAPDEVQSSVDHLHAIDPGVTPATPPPQDPGPVAQRPAGSAPDHEGGPARCCIRFPTTVYRTPRPRNVAATRNGSSVRPGR